MKVGIIRLDKLGDLVASLPADEVIPSTHAVSWIISQGWEPLLKWAQPPRQMALSLNLKKTWQSFTTLYQFLKTNRFDCLIILYAPWWAVLAGALTHSGRLYGRLSKGWSFILLSHGLRQKRSLSEKHEVDYSIELMAFAMKQLATPLSLVTSAHKGLRLEAPASRQLLEKYYLTAKSYVVIHPGMSGSAINWSTSHYLELIKQLTDHTPIVITGTQADLVWINPLFEIYKNHPQVTFLHQQLDLGQLLFILKQAKLVVAPSTGVAHLAASLGSPLIALYPGNQKQSPIRWKPLGPKVTLLTSDQPQLSSITPQQILDIYLKLNKD